MMIDKVPETTTLQFTLPRSSAERVRAIAERQRISLDEAVRAACEWWVREHESANASTGSEPGASADVISQTSLPMADAQSDLRMIGAGMPLPVTPPPVTGLIRDIDGPVDDEAISPPFTPTRPKGRRITSVRSTLPREPSLMPDE
jgi:hypothetical protein